MGGQFQRQHQTGAALLLAMLTVSLVATFAVATHWRQWEAFGSEVSQQDQRNARWLLGGALAWGRDILRNDAQSGTFDHLGEPWAQPIAPIPLDAFVSAGNRAVSAPVSGAVADSSLALEIQDLQARFNLRNLVDGEDAEPEISSKDMEVAYRLFSSLGLPPQELTSLAEQLKSAVLDETPSAGVIKPVLPSRLDDLAAMGLSASTVQRLAPHATWLPERTPLNINTATVQVLSAAIEGLGLSKAEQLAQFRRNQPFRELADTRRVLGPVSTGLDSERLGTSSRYFLVTARLRIGEREHDTSALVLRDQRGVRTIWRYPLQ